jgi:dolichyl-phosphate beta-glucosyltransferase
MDRGGQILIAVRDLLVIHKGLLRKIMSTSGNLLAQFWITPGIKDTQCGFKAFEASVAEDLFGRITRLRWSFDMEVLAIARQRHYKVETFEAPDWFDPKGEDDGLVGDSVLQVAIGAFLDPLRIRLGIWAGRYKQPHYKHQPRY